MSLSYTAPNWSDGEGVSISNLQSISNALEGVIQGNDKAIHALELNNNVITITYVDGSIETFTGEGLKGIADITKSSSGATDTYTIVYTDGTTYDFKVVNGGVMVEANPTLSGDESALNSIKIGDEKYKIEGGGGGNADKVELTKAEYDALPSSKLSDGKMYFINDWGQPNTENKILDGNEHIIGSWFNKPLYRKVLSVNVNFAKTTNWTNVVSVADLNLKKLINIRALNDDDKGGVYQTPDFRVTTAGMLQYYIAVSSSWNVRQLIIEYTKTTD